MIRSWDDIQYILETRIKTVKKNKKIHISNNIVKQ